MNPRIRRRGFASGFGAHHDTQTRCAAVLSNDAIGQLLKIAESLEIMSTPAIEFAKQGCLKIADIGFASATDAAVCFDMTSIRSSTPLGRSWPGAPLTPP